MFVEMNCESTNITYSQVESVMDTSSVREDLIEASDEEGLTPLPDIPSLVLPVATHLVPRLLKVAEFLATFTEVLKLKTKPTAGNTVVSV